MYADDSKVIAKSGSKLQDGIVKIKEWCDRWSMCLNSSKCKVMHFGRGNPGKEYYIGSGDERVILEKTEADLGLIICNDGKNNRQAVKAINRANSELGRLRNNKNGH